MAITIYESIDDLPTALRQEYPQQACELYCAVYNRVLEKEMMNQPGMSNTDMRAATNTAHEAALLAIRTEFAKDSSGVWRRAPIGSEMKLDAQNRHKT